MKKNLLIVLVLVFANFGFAQNIILTEPSFSPDGSEIAFISGGDIWTVPSSGGEARILISHEATEQRPLYSSDGKYLAFTSNRTGNGDIYVFEFSSGAITRLTFDDSGEDLNAWSPDSKFLYFYSTGKEIAGMGDVFKISVKGGTPMPVLDEPYSNEFFASPSPDGNTLAFTARGVASRQWWRNGHSHLDQSEIWLKQKKNSEYQKVVDRDGKNIWPMWSKDSNTLYYVSDRDGKENLWMKTGTTSKQLTSFKDGRLLWPSVSNDGNWIVFERDLAIWKYSVASQKAEPLTITRRGAVSAPGNQQLKLTREFSDLALSPDGKKVLFTARGDLFAASAKDGGDAFRITATYEPEASARWSPDNKTIIFASSHEGVTHLYQFDFIKRTTKRLTNDVLPDNSPYLSPDGKSLAFFRNRKELRVLDLSAEKEKLIAKGSFSGDILGENALAWSPDNKWLAYTSHGNKAFRNIYVVPAAGGESKVVSFLANTFGGNILWSASGKYLLYLTRQRTEDSKIARIDLIPKVPQFTEDRFVDLFNEPKTSPAEKPKTEIKSTAPADSILDKSKVASKTLQINFNGIQQRMSFLPVGFDLNDMVLSHDGKTLVLTATVAGQENLYTFSLDELSREQPVARQLTSTTGQKRDPQFSPDDKELYYLEGEKIQKITIESKQTKTVDITAELEINFNAQKMAVFKQAWEIQRDNFYDTAYHSMDWNKARKKYEGFAMQSQTPDELRRVINLMIGELNASHSGINAPQSAQITSSGRLGLKFDKEVYESTGKLKIKSLIPLGPADVIGSIKTGDYLVAVNDTLIKENINLDQLLLNKINKRVTLTVNTTPTMTGARQVSLRPVAMAAEKGLLYREWVQQMRDYVHKMSNGRLGYVHMFDMGMESLNQLHIDLDAENHARDGVVVDVRNNNGGFVNAYALDILSRQPYMTMTVRGLPSAPARTMLGQRALEAPTVLVTNQHSLSDAEDFTEGYKTMKLGTVVGEPTAGWIIYTSNIPLVDGSSLRVPFIRVTDHEGKNMELAPRTVDVSVTRALGESANNKDTQLDTAIRVLLEQLDKGKLKAQVGSKK
jgi:tricorn protease